MRRVYCLLPAILVACGDPPAPPEAPSDAGPTPPSAAAAASDAPAVDSSPARAAERAPSAPRAVLDAPEADEVVPIPAGTLRVGSRPGTADRDPSAEADLPPVSVPAFDIDALPFPNDPEQPPQLAGTRREAEQLCAARGRRLCHELEWERACRGDGVDDFPTGDSMDVEACVADPLACPSTLGVFDLGVRAPEWTASDAGEHLAYLERTAVVRGGRPEYSLASHRCGTRAAVDPQGGGRARAFRCCGGEPPEDLAYPDVGVRRQFRDLELDTARWREILASVPEVARFAQAFEPYGEPAATRALSRGGATAEQVPWSVAPGPFAWSPATGEEVWVVAGQSGESSLIAVLYVNPDQSFHHAASFVFAEPQTPIAILRTPPERAQLLWSTCWSCGGENGTIEYGEDARIVIAQR